MSDESKARLLPPEALTSLMTDTIKKNGGRMRFDEYMAESLYGEQGYYTARVEIGTSGDFTTDAEDQLFAQILARYAQQQGFSNRTFLELGGGTGTFKKNYLGLNPGTEYISVDVSPKLIALQAEAGPGVVLLGNATKLPDAIQSGSIEGIVFGNELLDELPGRVLKIGIQGPENTPKVVEEGFVTLSDSSEIVFDFQEVEWDEFINEYERYLLETGKRAEEGDILTVSPHVRSVLSEVDRVMAPGSHALFFDYGHMDRYSAFRRDREEIPYYDGGDLESIVARPYQTDITYRVDFDHCLWVAGQIALTKQDSIYPMDWFARAFTREGDEYFSSMRAITGQRDFAVVELVKK